MTVSGDAPLAGTTVGRVALGVNDLDRVAEFYEEAIGLERIEDAADRVVLGAGDDPLLVVNADPEASERTAEETGLFHAAFRVPSREALSDALERVEEHSRLTGASDHHVSEALYLQDPEGNGVEIYRDRDRSEWPTDEDGRVEMDTLPLDLDALRGLGAGADSVPPGTDVGHVHLEVSDLSNAREFYVDALGLRVRQRQGDSALFLAADDYHHHVGLNTWNDRSESPLGRGLEWFELLVPDEETYESLENRLLRSGLSPRITDVGFTITDPDGIQLRVAVAD